MKQNHKLGISTSMRVLLFTLSLTCLVFGSCKEDDPVVVDQDQTTNTDNGNANASAGSNNTKDMAVTGEVTNITTSAATIKGYINIDQTQLMSIQEFGIEYETSFSSPKKMNVSGYTGREFSVSLSSLEPATTYYYRTYIRLVSGIYMYGEKLSFKTKNVEWEVRDITYTGATIHYPYPGTRFSGETQVFLTRNPSDTVKYHGWSFYPDTSPYLRTTAYNAWYTFTDLTPNTTYYCYLQAMAGYRTPVVSFTTKAYDIDVSGVSASFSYKPTYNSYVNWYGKTVDLKWLKGKYTATITSNLGSGYKYGVEIGGVCYYSTNTSSPYTVVADYPYDTWDIDRIVVMLELGWERTDAEDEELTVLIDDLDHSYPIVNAFVEKDGARIVVDSYCAM